MHEKSEWGQGMYRTDSYWRPSGGLYYPGGSLRRNWTANGRYHPHAYARYSNQFSNRHSDHRSYGAKWRDHSNPYKEHTSYRGTSYPVPMAPGHRKGKSRARGGSRPFPSKLISNTDSTIPSSTVSSTNSKPSSDSSFSSKCSSPNKSLSSSKRNDVDVNSSSSSLSSASSLSSPSWKSYGANTSSRPDQGDSEKDQSWTYEDISERMKLSTSNEPSTPSSCSTTSSYSSLSISTPSSKHSKSNIKKDSRKSSSIAQTYSVSVSSSNHQKMKFLKCSNSLELSPIPLSTLDYCKSVPILREILHNKPVVVLEKLTEKLIRKKLDYAGLNFCGNLQNILLNKKTKKKHLHMKGLGNKKTDDSHYKKSLKVVLSVNLKEETDENVQKVQMDSKVSPEFSNSEHEIDLSDTKEKMLLVDPKVISLSRPLQTAYSNNTSKTNMPFKNSGRGKTPSKSFPPKSTGPVPRHMQMFDLDKLRNKLKGANFGGSRKPRQIHNKQEGSDSVGKASFQTTESNNELIPQLCHPDNVYECTTFPADSTKDDRKTVNTQGETSYCPPEDHENEHAQHKGKVSDLSACNIGVKQNLDADNIIHCGSSKASENLSSNTSAEETLNNSASEKSNNIDIEDSVNSVEQIKARHTKVGEVLSHSGREKEPNVYICCDNVSSTSETSPVLSQMAMDSKDNKSDEEASSIDIKSTSGEEVGKEKSVDISIHSKLDSQCIDKSCEEAPLAERDSVHLEEGIDLSKQSLECEQYQKETSNNKPALTVSETANHHFNELRNTDASFPITCGSTSKSDTHESDSTTQKHIADHCVVGEETDCPVLSEENLKNCIPHVTVNENLDNMLKKPSSLIDICKQMICRTDLSSAKVSITKRTNDESIAEAKSSHEVSVGKAKCLGDMVSFPHKEAVDLSTAKSDNQDDLSPMCIITNVESGAHVYFSESESDLNTNSAGKTQDNSNSSSAEADGTETDIVNAMTYSDTTTSNSSPQNQTQVESEPVLNPVELSSTNLNTVATVVPALHSQDFTVQYSSGPKYPASIENENASSQGDQNYSPSGTESVMTLSTSGKTSPVSLFPMILPTVPSAYPNNNQTEVNHTSSNTIQSAKDNESCFADLSARDMTVSSEACRSPSVTVVGTVLHDIPDANTCIDMTAAESSCSVASHESSVVTSVCQDIQNSNKTTPIVSDLDVMHYYDEEPPVLPQMSIIDPEKASELQEVTFLDNSQQPVGCPQIEEDAVNACVPLSVNTVNNTEHCVSASCSQDGNKESSSEVNLNMSEAEIDKSYLKLDCEERVEVGRLNLRRVHGDDSDDSDATLIYSCDEDNTCFEEIFQENVSQTWPRNAPWTDSEDAKTPSLYEGKLVIVSDMVNEGDLDGEISSDTNTSNERLSLIITTLRKDLEEKKSDRRQAERIQPADDTDHACVEEVKTSKGKKRKCLNSRRKRTTIEVPSDEYGGSSDREIAQPENMATFKQRDNLIVTIHRKNADKEILSVRPSDELPKCGSTKVKPVSNECKQKRKSLTKPRRRIKRRLTVKRRKKKGGRPVDDVSAPDTATGVQRTQKTQKKTSKRVKKRKPMVHVKREKKENKKEITEVAEVKKEDLQDSDDSDELPTILPPKRRRLQVKGNSLMMMQNSIGKGNSSERIMREFPRHNWLEQKINQLQQQTTCSPTPSEEDVTSQVREQQDMKHGSPEGADSKVETCLDLRQETTDPDLDLTSSVVGEDPENKSVPKEASQETDEELTNTVNNTEAITAEQDSFSLQEAMKLVGAEESEGQLVIDERQFESKENESTDKETKEVNSSTNLTAEDNDQNNILSESKKENLKHQVESNEKEDDSSSKIAVIGLPLDLCVRKAEKTTAGAGRQKTYPPVQMVLPQIKQPVSPVSTDPVLVKETKEIVQNLVVVPQEDNPDPPVCVGTLHSTNTEAVNLSKVTAEQHQVASNDFSEMVRGVMMPEVMQPENGNLQCHNENISTNPSNVICKDPSFGQSASGTPQTSPAAILHENPSISSPNAMSLPSTRLHESPAVHPSQPIQAPINLPGQVRVPLAGLSQPHAIPRMSHPQRNMDGRNLDREFEKHLKEFKQLEMLAARKEREREALLHLKKRKAMLLKEMKYLKTHQNIDAESPQHGPPPAHSGMQLRSPPGIEQQINRPQLQNTQNQSQVAELRPFQAGMQTMVTAQPQVDLHQSNHPLYTASPMSQTLTSSSSKVGTGQLNHDGSSHRKRHSEDRRPIVQMINLAMLQRGRKFRRLNEEQRGTGGNSSGTVPAPAHQNKTEVFMNHDADVPSSEITHCPYIKRKTPLLEPPGSTRVVPASAALVPAHSQQPFQTAGSLIVPAKSGPEENLPPPYPPSNQHQRLTNVASASQSHSFPQLASPPTHHKNTLSSEVLSEPKSRSTTESTFNLHHAQDQPMPYLNSAERNVANTTAYPMEHFGSAQPHWSPRMPSQFSSNAHLPAQQNLPGMQSVRQMVPQGLHQDVRHPSSHGIRIERSMDVIDLTKEHDPSKSDMLHHMPASTSNAGEGVPAETESTVQRELTAALARRHGFEHQSVMTRRNQDMPMPSHVNYNTKPYQGHPLGSQAVQQHSHANPMYPPQSSATKGNMIPSSSDTSYQMQSKPGTVNNPYRMQEPTSVKSALLAHGSKMVCPPSYPMNTSASATSISAAHYQQQRNMKVPQQMTSSAPSVEGYSHIAEKNAMIPVHMPLQQQIPAGYNEHMSRSGQSMQYKPQPNWRPQVPTSVSSVQMSLEKQQQLMMMTRKTQWEQFQQQKLALAQKNHSLQSGSHVQVMHSVPQNTGANYAMAQVAAQGNQDHAMQQRATMHEHNMRLMQRGPAPAAAQMQAKMQQAAAGYPRETGLMTPGQNTAPALIEFQQQESQRRMPHMPPPMNQLPPRLHQFNGSCVVCGALAMYLCSSCRMVWYCSQTCQNNHWKRHGPECKPVQKPGIPSHI